MKYPNAIGPAMGVYSRVVRAHWPRLLALTIAYPLLNWGASLGWKALPVATGWMEIGLNGAQILVWAMAWGLMGAVLTQLTLATTDGRSADPGALLRACAGALPVVALMVLITDVTSLPLSLWRAHMVASGELRDAGLASLLSVPFAVLDAAAFWLLAMAVPVRLDQELPLIETVKASARLARRRWRTMLLVFGLAGVGLLVFGLAIVVLGLVAGAPADGKPPVWMKDTYVLQAPFQVLSMVWLLFWPALYVTFRNQDGTAGVAETFA